MLKSLLTPGLLALASLLSPLQGANPIITDVCTADPAVIVHDGRVYLYAGHDEGDEKKTGYVLNEWLCFSSTDLVNWERHGAILTPKAFAWAAKDAWAGHVIERAGKFYWYVPMWHGTIHGFSIGVAVADSPTGPFKDARGSALITNDMTTDATISWDDIDPAAFIDDDGQAYLFWGNTQCRYVKLKENMTEMDGPIVNVDLPRFTEAPWVHKRNGLYYLTYATGFPERLAYATAEKITGPWTFRGEFKPLAGNCNTNHQAIITYKGKDLLFYHNGGLLTGSSFRRSVCIEYLHYNADGTLRTVAETMEGVGPLE